LDLAKKSSGKFLLASSIDVYQGRMSQLDLVEYFGKNKMDENKYSLTEAKRFGEALVWEYYKKYNTDVRIVRLPEVYGPRMNFESSGSLGEFLKDLIEGRDLSVYGDGAENEFYLYITDAVSGIIKALFTPSTKGNIYSLTSQGPYTVLETAYLAKSVANREVQIQFKPSVMRPEPFAKIPDTSNLKDLVWEPRVSFKEGIIKTLDSFGYAANEHPFKPAKIIEQKKLEKSGKSTKPEQLFSLQGIKEEASGAAKPVPPQAMQPPPSPVKPPETKLKPETRKPFPKLLKTVILADVALLISAGIVFLAFPAYQVYRGMREGAKLLERMPNLWVQLDFSSAQKDSSKASEDFKDARFSYKRFRWIYYGLNKKEQFDSMDKLLSSLSYFSQSVSDISFAMTPFGDIGEVIRPDSDKKVNNEDFNKAKLEISKAKSNLQLAEAAYKYVNVNVLPKQLKGKTELYGKYLTDASVGLDVASTLSEDLPQILGVQSPQKYLVLFQNSNEIRPTGGFIGSYGILDLQDGKIKNLTIDDIYNPDGQIDLKNVKIAPPKPITDFLGEDRLYLRNANWDPNFSDSARTIADLYARVTGDRIDGVLAVDLYFVQKLLKATGPVFLTAYNEEITSENLYERAQFHSDFNYRNGSAQKRSFLTVLGGKLLEKLLQLPKEQLPSLFEQLASSLSERHLMLYFSNSSLNSVLAQQKWDGGLVQTDKDYLFVVNANLGGTKANYYVKNKMKYEITSQTRDGLLRANLYLEYSHTAEDGAWPGGPYTNYVRVLTQDGSKLTGAKVINGNSPEEDIFKKVVISKEGKYNSFETSFVLKPKTTLKLTLSYDLPQNLSLIKDYKEYSLYWQKEPGTENDQVEFSFSPPFGMSIDKQDPSLQAEGEKIKYNGILNTDKNFYIELR